jgi:hypothetical protein
VPCQAWGAGISGDAPGDDGHGRARWPTGPEAVAAAAFVPEGVDGRARGRSDGGAPAPLADGRTGAFGGCTGTHVGADAADGRGEVNAVDRVPAVADAAEHGGVGAAALG